MWYETLLDPNLIPEFLVRLFIKIHFRMKLRREPKDIEQKQQDMMDFIQFLKTQPIALHTDDANEQHYELEPDFFQQILGFWTKYSCCLWKNKPRKKELVENLEFAEEEMLKLYSERAQIKDGQQILDLGCGWGSLSVFLAKTYPNTQILAISNSKNQNKYIISQIKKRNLQNLEVKTTDINDFTTTKKFDRILSIEMFEHMRNYQKLMEKLAGLLNSEGLLFIHIFTHDGLPYLFNDQNAKWMTKYFFSGGMMPSADLLLYFLDHFSVEQIWKVNGVHYYYTLLAWWKKMKKNKKKIVPILKNIYGKTYRKWWTRWKLFFIVLSEVFRAKKGNIRYVSHYLFKVKK